MTSACFDVVEPIEAAEPTLIEGLPGHGLVASIAVDQVTDQLALTHTGNVTADAFPPVVTFDDGLVRNLVRVYGGTDPSVLTLKSDIALPQPAFEPLADCVLTDLAGTFGKGIFIAGAPAESEEQIGDVTGVATTPALRAELEAAGVTVAKDQGLVGGITGTLVRECHRREVPAQLLIVRAHPFLPDPRAAQAVIEEALEPLVEFEIDTTPLAERAEEIKARMQQVAAQYRQMAEEGQPQQQTGMFQ